MNMNWMNSFLRFTSAAVLEICGPGFRARRSLIFLRTAGELFGKRLVNFSGVEGPSVVEALTPFSFPSISCYSANTPGFHDEGDCCHSVVA
jgi:hypothetical protein